MNIKSEEQLHELTDVLMGLATLGFFRTDDAAIASLAEIAVGMADNIDQIRWVARRMTQLYNEWPGPKEFRAVFCSRWRPRDGIEASADMEGFPEGLPVDPNLPQLLPLSLGEVVTRGLMNAPRKRLTSGKPATDADLTQGTKDLQKAVAMPDSEVGRR